MGVKFTATLPIKNRNCPNSYSSCKAYTYLENKQNIFQIASNTGSKFYPVFNLELSKDMPYDYFEKFIQICNDLHQICRDCILTNYSPR